MTEWVLHPLHWSRSPDFTARDSSCGRFTLTAKISHGSPFIRWSVYDRGHLVATHSSLMAAENAIVHIKAQEAAR